MPRDSLSTAYLLRGFRFVMLVLALLTLPAGRAASGSTFDEYRVKAAFLYNFFKFIDWPDDAALKDEKELVLGVADPAPFKGTLEALDGRQVGKRRLRVLVIRTVTDAKDCHLVYLNHPDKTRGQRLLVALQAYSVVTVGERPGFLQTGGMIRLFRDGVNIRFAINRKAIQESRVEISSHLLKLAQNEPGTAGGAR